MRHDIYEGVSFYIVKGIKPNYAELARQYHCDLRTVKKYYEARKGNELKKTRKTTKRVSKLEPYKTLIDKN